MHVGGTNTVREDSESLMDSAHQVRVAGVKADTKVGIVQRLQQLFTAAETFVEGPVGDPGLRTQPFDRRRRESGLRV